MLLIAEEDLTGLARLPHVLRQAGCRVSLIAGRDMLVTKTRFVDHHIASPGSLSELVEMSKKHLNENPNLYQWVIWADESVIRELSRNPDEEWLKTCFPVDPCSSAVRLINSKTDFNQAAQEMGLPVPYFKPCSGLEDAESAAEEIGYPVILKDPYGSCGLGVRVVPAATGFASAYQQFSDSSNPIVVQEFVSGKVGSTDVLYNHGKPVCWISTYSKTTLPKITGMSCVREVMYHPEIENLLSGVGKLTGFHGLGGVDWIHVAETNELKLVELNPRPTPGYHFGYRAGVDFSLAIREMLDGSPSIQRPQQPDRGSQTTIYMFPQDIYRIITDHALFSLLRWLPGLPGSRDLPLNDPCLLLTHLWRLSVRFLIETNKVLKRLLNRLNPFYNPNSCLEER